MTGSLELVPARAFLVPRPRIRLELQPGDRVTAVVGDVVRVGEVVAERIRGARLVEASSPRDGADQGIPLPGTWLPGEHARAGRHAGAPAGELLFEHAGRRRLATGPHPDRLHAPADGYVLEVEAGVALVLQIDGPGLVATELLGEPHSGRLIVMPEDADPRIVLDVALAGAVIVLQGRVDAEALARARAMGIHGAVVGSLADRTQFVVITHNRGTIEAADALFGVTVGDDAVSRVISLRLDEATAIADRVAGGAERGEGAVSDPRLAG